MALYYDVGPLCRRYNDDKVQVKNILEVFLVDSKHSLKQIKKAIERKNYSKVTKHLEKLKPSLEFLGIDQAMEEFGFIEKWIQDKGKIKEVKENFKAFKEHVKKAKKEIKKDFCLQKV